MPNSLATDRAAYVAGIAPDAYAASTVTSGWADASRFERFMAIFQAGTLGASATLDGKLQQATSSGGAGAKDIAGKAITQLTQAGTDSNKQAIVNLSGEELDVDGGFRYVRMSMTIGTAASDAGAQLIGMDPRYGPAKDFDDASVDEIVG